MAKSQEDPQSDDDDVSFVNNMSILDSPAMLHTIVVHEHIIAITIVFRETTPSESDKSSVNIDTTCTFVRLYHYAVEILMPHKIDSNHSLGTHVT